MTSVHPEAARGAVSTSTAAAAGIRLGPVVLTALALLCAACGGDDGASEAPPAATTDAGASPTADARDTSVGPKDTSGGTGAPDAGPETSTEPPDPGPPADTVHPPDMVELGTHQTGQTAPTWFLALADQGEAPVVLGPQGAWMVVVGVRTNVFTATTDRLEVALTLALADGQSLGTLSVTKAKLFDGGDGLRYVMNLFLVVDNAIAWDDSDATLSFTGESDDGRRADATVAVHLVRR